MKLSILKKSLSLLLVAVMMICALPCGTLAEGPQTQKRLEPVTMTLYKGDSTCVESITVAFADEAHEIPYISITTAVNYLGEIATLCQDTTCFYTLERADSRYKITRENGSFIILDGETQTVSISGIQELKSNSYASNAGDIVSGRGVFLDDDGNVLTAEDGTPFVEYIARADNKYNFVNTGYNLVCNIKEEYGIELILQDDELYIPVATLNDLFLNGAYFLYNGEAMFITTTTFDSDEKDENGKTIKDLYYAVEPRLRSKELAEFTYNELCMFLDLNYGLAAEHNITDGFQKFFEAAGLKDDLCSTDSTVFEKTLCDVLLGYMSDLHSSFLSNSSYTGNTGIPVDYSDGNYISIIRCFDNQDIFKAARQASGISAANEKGADTILEAYSEIGDTAFITFDTFYFKPGDYYNMTDEEIAQACSANDLVGLVIYANKQINRENSPIRKVVIDLSMNGGGQADACIYIAAWVLGKAQFSAMNPLTQACYTNLYTVDVDLDRKAGGEGDSLDLTKLDVYCLISGNSFSCGNLLPSMFKADGRVTLVGQTSGGGACVVQFAAAADGSTYRCSSFFKLCTVKNGSYYSIDQGVEPDIALRKASSFYDREWLVTYLDTIH